MNTSCSMHTQHGAARCGGAPRRTARHTGSVVVSLSLELSVGANDTVIFAYLEEIDPSTGAVNGRAPQQAVQCLRLRLRIFQSIHRRCCPRAYITTADIFVLAIPFRLFLDTEMSE